MQYSPKLKKATEEIKGILQKYDIGGLIFLHTPGHTEYLVRLNTGYSCVRIEPDGQIRAKAKLADFNGDKKAWTLKVSDTCNMLNCLTTVTGKILLPLIELSESLDKQVGAQHSGDGFTNIVEQNN